MFQFFSFFYSLKIKEGPILLHNSCQLTFLLARKKEICSFYCSLCFSASECENTKFWKSVNQWRHKGQALWEVWGSESSFWQEGKKSFHLFIYCRKITTLQKLNLLGFLLTWLQPDASYQTLVLWSLFNKKRTTTHVRPTGTMLYFYCSVSSTDFFFFFSSLYLFFVVNTKPDKRLTHNKHASFLPLECIVSTQSISAVEQWSTSHLKNKQKEK